jgi:hypothetical protein
MPAIHFESKLFKIGSETVLLFSESASKKLPSRGMVMVEGKINGFKFLSPLEPDGRGSHFLKMDKAMLDGARAKAGTTVTLSVEPVKAWPEPMVPEDLEKALKASPNEYDLWNNVTPIARWDWIRWILSTKNPQTRKRRIEVELSKLKKGMKRPCCFNRSMCCDITVSKNGVLLNFPVLELSARGS